MKDKVLTDYWWLGGKLMDWLIWEMWDKFLGSGSLLGKNDNWNGLYSSVALYTIYTE